MSWQQTMYGRGGNPLLGGGGLGTSGGAQWDWEYGIPKGPAWDHLRDDDDPLDDLEPWQLLELTGAPEQDIELARQRGQRTRTGQVAEALDVEPEGERGRGFLHGLGRVLDTGKSTSVGLVSGLAGWDREEDDTRSEDLVTDDSFTGRLGAGLGRAQRAIVDGESYGSGDFEEAFRYGDDASTGEKFRNNLGAFLVDTALDPLTYVSGGASVLGRKAASQAISNIGTKQARKGLTRNVGRETQDDAMRALGKDRVAREARTLAERQGVTDLPPVEQMRQMEWGELRHVMDTLDMDGTVTRGLTADGFGVRLGERYATEGATGARRYAEQTFGGEEGLAWFNSLPADLRGGLGMRRPGGRLTGGVEGTTGRRMPKRYTLPGSGGGQMMERLGARSLLDAGNRVRAIAAGRGPGGVLTNKASGRAGAYYGDVLRGFYRGEGDNEMAGSAYRLFRAKDQETQVLRNLESQWDEPLAQATAEVSRMVGKGAVREGLDEGEVKDAFRLYFNNRVLAEELTEEAVEALPDAKRAGWMAARKLHTDVFDTMGSYAQQVFGDNDRAMGWLNNYAARVRTQAEQERAERIGSGVSRAGGGGTTHTQTREQYPARWELDEDTGQLRVAEWLPPDEVARAAGRDVFIDDPLEQTVAWAEGMRSQLRAVSLAEYWDRTGMTMRLGLHPTRGVDEDAVAQTTAETLGRVNSWREALGTADETSLSGVLRETGVKAPTRKEADRLTKVASDRYVTSEGLEVRQAGDRWVAEVPADQMPLPEVEWAGSGNMFGSELGVVARDVTGGDLQWFASTPDGQVTRWASREDAQVALQQAGRRPRTVDAKSVQGARKQLADMLGTERDLRYAADLDELREVQLNALTSDAERLGRVLDTRTWRTEDPDELNDFLTNLVELVGRRGTQTTIDQMKRPTSAGADAAARRLGDAGLQRVTGDGLQGRVASELDLHARFGVGRVADDMKRMYGAKSGQVDTSKWVDEVWTPWYSAFKAWATVGRGPGYHARNLIGAEWNNYVGNVGVGNRKDAASVQIAHWHAVRDAKREFGLDAGDVLSGEAADFAEQRFVSTLEGRFGADKASTMNRAWESFFEQGLGGRGAGSKTRGQIAMFTGEGETQVGDPSIWGNRVHETVMDNKWMRASGRTAEESETYARFAAFLRGLDEYGMDDMESAGLFSKGLHFRYDDLSDFEQKVLKNFIPFYTWSRFNIPLQFRALFQEPGKVNKARRAHEAIGDTFRDDDEEGAMSEWHRDIFAFQTGLRTADGDPITLGMESPLTDLNSFFYMPGPGEGLLRGDQRFGPINTREVANNVNPFLTLAAETVTGVDSFTGQSLTAQRDAPRWAQLIPGMTEETPDGDVVNRSTALTRFVEGVVPPVSTASRLAPGTLGNERLEARKGTSWASWLGAVPAATLDPWQQRGALRSETDRINERMRGEVSNMDERRRMVQMLLDEGMEPEQVAGMGARDVNVDTFDTQAVRDNLRLEQRIQAMRDRGMSEEEIEFFLWQEFGQAGPPQTAPAAPAVRGGAGLDPWAGQP